MITRPSICIYTCRLCSDAEFMRGVWQRYDALATDGDTVSTSGARVFTLLISALKRLVTSRPALLGVSAQMHGVGVPASDLQPHLHSHHSLDTVAEMVATAASATVSNVVGMIGTEAGLSVQTATMKVQWCVSPINILSPLPFTVFFLLALISSTRQMPRSSLRHTYISSAYNASYRARACTGPTRPYNASRDRAGSCGTTNGACDA